MNEMESIKTEDASNLQNFDGSKKRSLSPTMEADDESPTKCQKLSDETGKPKKRRSFIAGRRSTINFPLPDLEDIHSQSEESESEKPKRVLLPNPINEQTKEAAKCTEADIQRFQNECDEWKRVLDGFIQKVEELEKDGEKTRLIAEKPQSLSTLQQKWLDNRPNYGDKLDKLKSNFTKLDVTVQCVKAKIDQMKVYAGVVDNYIQSVSTNFKNALVDGEIDDPKSLISKICKNPEQSS
ncbi:uncharacterized protein LOC141909295 [Tubulanus polymorphus]|uniref:uncharacterized protein LOC141909295 n=1 Tax=Tubulanus polymorphus TaxID=672921 RepID=UPI003DA4D682